MIRKGVPLRDINNTYNTRSFKGGEAALRGTAYPRGEIAPRPDLSPMLSQREVALLVAKKLRATGLLKASA